MKASSIKLALALSVGLIVSIPAASAQTEIPRAASTPTTPKNWVAPVAKMRAQAMVDQLAAAHPEVMSITMHAVPAGMKDYTMIAGTFPDRVGNTSSPGDIITAAKGVTQVESKWGGPDFGKKVSIVLPLKDTAGKYLPVAMVVAFKQSPETGLIDLDFVQPGARMRDSLQSRIPDYASLFAPAG